MRIFDYGKAKYYGRFFFSILFYLVIIIVLLNIVFGIIIDTFAELREETTKKDHDIRNICFICGADRNSIEKANLNFRKHIKQIHNHWDYIYYILALLQLDPQDLNAVDSFCLEKIQERSIAWLPDGAKYEEES